METEEEQEGKVSYAAGLGRGEELALARASSGFTSWGKVEGRERTLSRKTLFRVIKPAHKGRRTLLANSPAQGPVSTLLPWQ